MPDWAITLLAALVGGVIGTIGSTLLRISHERSAELRTRMLEVADEFVAAAMNAVDRAIEHDLKYSLRKLEAEARTGRPALSAEHRQEIDELWDIMSEAVRETLRRLPRIRLLFGVDSQAAREAKAACDKLGERSACSSACLTTLRHSHRTDRRGVFIGMQMVRAI